MSSLISFVPRQVALHDQPQSAPAQKNEKKTKTSMAKKERLTSPAESAPATCIEMKDKKMKKKSKKSSRTKLLLLQSIAAYLETNGFASTLSALRSEAELENTDYKGATTNLEDIFFKCLESREAEEQMNHGVMESKNCVDLAEVKASDKPLNDSHMAPMEKKKKQQLASDETSDKKIKKSVLESLGDNEKNLDLELPGAVVQNIDKYKKKKHKKAPDHNDGVSEANDLGEFRETVKEKVEELKSLVHNSTNGIDDSTTKRKDEKKKKKKEASEFLLVNTEIPKNSSDETSEKLNLAADCNADTQRLDKKDAKHKDKKKKNKSSSEGISEVSAVDIRDSVKGENEKTVSKKRKRSQSEEESQQNMDAKDSSDLKSEAADDNSILSTLQKDRMPLLAHEPQLLTKKRKTENKENGSMQNGIPYQNDSENQEANGLVNGELNQSKVDGGALSTKKEKRSAEPKTVHAFQRVKVDVVEFVDERLQDNSYWAKDGADNGYGAKAQEILGQVRGRDFRHEKTKKKRGSYRGGQIDLHSHSIKFNYSEEE